MSTAFYLLLGLTISWGGLEPTGAGAQTPAASPPVVRAAPARRTGAERVLAGYVLGADGLALPGVTARIVGTTQLVVTNADGIFRLPLPPATGRPVRVVCSYAGLADCEVVLTAGQRVLCLEMVEQDQRLAEHRR